MSLTISATSSVLTLQQSVTQKNEEGQRSLHCHLASCCYLDVQKNPILFFLPKFGDLTLSHRKTINSTKILKNATP